MLIIRVRKGTSFGSLPWGSWSVPSGSPEGIVYWCKQVCDDWNTAEVYEADSELRIGRWHHNSGYTELAHENFIYGRGYVSKETETHA